MTPEVKILNTGYSVSEETSDTYKMNMESLNIEGLCSQNKAMEQAIYKLIMTENNTYVIYDKSYGIKLKDLYGKSVSYVAAMIKLRLEEAFKQDSRIKRIENFAVNSSKSKIILEFSVVTIYGTIDIKQEI